ncbi:hypothetical protein Q4485_14010 [Granulosicoccaceae sp. 1_MG-2023]|nr:hypothetical protein [Granulosicoccaceae sp. 1_MG-2023]
MTQRTSKTASAALAESSARCAVFPDFVAQDAAIARLRAQVRYGLMVDCPPCIMNWFSEEERRVDGADARRQLYVAEFHLLLDVYADALVDRIWRYCCLDHIFYPLRRPEPAG